MLIDSKPLFDPASADGPSPRDTFLDDPGEVVKTTALTFETGIQALARLVVNQRTPAASLELAKHLERWVAYLPLDIELGLSFVLAFEQSLAFSTELSRREEFDQVVGQTSQEYPLALRDAASVHVEVVLNDPALCIGSRRAVLLGSRKSVRIGKTEYVWSKRRLQSAQVRGVCLVQLESGKPIDYLPVAAHFDHEDSTSDQERSLYAARGVGEAPKLKLLVPLELALSTFSAYLLAGAFFVALTLFVSGAWLVAAIENKPLYTPEAVFPLNAFGMTLSLWLTTSQPKRPLVFKELRLVRTIFVFGMLLLLAAPVFFALWWLVPRIVW